MNSYCQRVMSYQPWCGAVPLALYFLDDCLFLLLNTLRPRQNGCHFADYIFKCISFNENVWIPIKISLKFVPKGPINNSPSLVQMMVWRRPGAKPLSEPMMVSLLTHICVTRPQWVNTLRPRQDGQHIAEDIFKCIFFKKIFRILDEISLKYVP